MSNYHLRISLNHTMIYKTLNNVQLQYQDNIYYFYLSGELVFATPAAATIVERISENEIHNHFIDMADEACWSC